MRYQVTPVSGGPNYLWKEVTSMSKALVAVVLFLSAGVAYGQELRKGNLVGVHHISVRLEPGVTMQQFVDFYNKRVVPAYEEAYPGWRAYPAKRVRGETADGMGLIIVIPSERERDMYYNADGSNSELGKAAQAKVQPILDEMGKLGTVTADPYVDWVIY
jgi:hypothetical protein